jgi:hypothetical protein
MQLVNMRTYQYLKADKDRKRAQVLELNEEFAPIDQKFIVHNEARRNYLVFDTYQDFKVWFAANPTQRTLHEVIRGKQMQKLKFDIDAAADKLDALEDMPEPTPPVACADSYGLDFIDEYLDATWAEEMRKYEVNLARWHATSPRDRKAQRMFNTILWAIKKCFSDTYATELYSEDFTLSNSSDETKYSRHVVIKSFCVKNNNEARFFTNKVIALLPENIMQFLDAGVNKSVQNFRLPECHKVNSKRIKLPTRGSFDEMVITQTEGALELPAVGITSVRHEAVELAGDVEAAVITMAEPFAEGLKFHKRVGSLFHYRRERPSYCAICDRQHDSDNTLYVSVAKNCVKVHCRHAPRSQCIGWIGDAPQQQQFGENVVPKKFAPEAKIPTEFSVEQYCEPGLREFKFYGNKYDTLLIKSGMGTGKTKMLLEYLAPLPQEIGVVFVSFRRSFTTELKEKLQGKFVDYRDVKGEITSPRVIIQFESLHRLRMPVGKQILLVLDESESIINQIENKQMVGAGTLRRCWENFQWLMSNAAKVIAMDAFASYRTYTLLSKTRKSVHMHWNSYIPPRENAPTDYYYDSQEDFLSAVYATAPHAKESPFVIVSTVKKQSDALVQKIRDLCPGANIKSYSSDSTEQDRMDFDNVNAAWADVDVLIYTSTVSAGCSFELPRFKRIFAYFSDQSCDYKTAIQMLGRVRNVESREYHIYCKYSSSDLPDTVEEIERAIATRVEIANIVCNPLEMPKMINATGTYEYTLKDLYYHLHIGNIVHRCQSRNHFSRLFQQCRRESVFRLKKKLLS